MSKRGIYMHSFSHYIQDSKVLQAIEDLGYKKPTPIQEKVLPIVQSKQDVIAKSKTGSGKTAAFAIPLIEQMNWEENKPQVLVLVPTRELAVQVKEDFTNIGRYKRIKAVAVYGRQPIRFQMTALRQKTHVVVGTPGRIMDHIERGTLHLDQLTTLVIDEADELLHMGFIDQVEKIIKKLPTKRQTLLFSATYADEIKRLAEKYMKTPVFIEHEAKEQEKTAIRQQRIQVKAEDKIRVLRDVTVVQNPDSCIIFCNTKEQVRSVCDQLEKAHYSVDMLHGGMTQDDRLAVMKDFRKGDFRYLVATDVAARGIDIEGISLVVQYDVPFEKESYVHRMGRTGRAGQQGTAILLSSPNEKRYVQEIEEYIEKTIPVEKAPTTEEVAENQAAFEEKMNTRPERKVMKSEQLNAHITKLYFNGGKKKKIRAVDFVGTIAKIDGVTADDIGIITIEDTCSFVEILNGKGTLVLKEMQNRTVKNKKLKVHVAKKA
ncbi:DEAD/DEAH box helicase [Kurthia gibsonii]|nr:DEAD/DEAH box helicase [Kurthia gibsonii]MEB7773126.1 DEAD/DEAH box helicase [Kurthia gibsonii]